MRERKAIKENGLVDAADKFDDIYQRMEALASHAHDLIKHAGDEKLVADWWSGMQGALEKMQSVSGEIRQPNLPGMEPTESTEQDTDQAQVQEEDMKDDMQETISMLAKLAGLGEAGGHKPDADKDGIPDWADKNPHKASDDEDRLEEGACTTCHQDPCECESVEEAAKNPYAVGMAQAMKSTGDEPPLKKSTITKAHEIAKAVDKKESVEESVEIEECGMPIADAEQMVAVPSGAGMPELTMHDLANTQPEEKEVFHLNVKTPTKTMTFVTDNPEEIIKVLQASGVSVESAMTTSPSAEQYTPPSRPPVPTQGEMNKTAGEAPKSPSMTPVGEPKEEAKEEAKPDYIDIDKDGDTKESMKKAANDKEEDNEMKESISRLRKLSGYTVVDEGKFGNSVAGPNGDPKVVGDTVDFAMTGTGNAKSGRGDKGLSTFGDNPLGRNDRDLTEDKMMAEFNTWLSEQQEGK